MKRRPKPKPRVTQLDRIEGKLETLHDSIGGRLDYVIGRVPLIMRLKEDCAVLASHNRRLLEENETLKRWLTRLQARSTRTTPACPECAGSGRVKSGADSYGDLTTRCPACSGTGERLAVNKDAGA